MMILRSVELVDDFKAKNADSRTGLEKFVLDVSNCNARNYIELKNTFSGVDYVTPNYVFNISGNSYRLLAAVSFQLQRVIALKIGTHADYDRWKL